MSCPPVPPGRASRAGARTGTAAPSPQPVAWLPEQWRMLFERTGEPTYRATQVFRWVHRRGVMDPHQMTDLSRGLRQRIAEVGLREPGCVRHVERADDGTRKLLIEFADEARIECVLIPMSSELEQPTADADAAAADDEDDASRQQVTLCVSTQHGCKMGCVFCASGKAGFRRHLDASEIVYQVLAARRHLDRTEQLRNVVFMGMGEPLDAYQQTARALRLLMHPEGVGLSPRRITVSTVGLVPGMEYLGRDFTGKVGLALSLHAPDDVTRSRLVPVNRRYPVAALVQALRAYPLPRRRRFTIECALVSGVNDRPAQARALAELLRGLPVKINLIPLNRIAGCELRAPGPRRIEAFRQQLAEQGYSCFVRTRRGDEVAAACGQLALSGPDEDRGPGGARPIR
jgi:23S rRNA (adenine2503-C2)-methyltransferase